MSQPRPIPPPRSIPEGALDRTIQFVDGPLNRIAERAMKSRILLMPAGLGLNLWCRSSIAAQTGDWKALFRRPRGDEGRAR